MATIIGDDTANVLIGTPEGDLILGLGGNDQIDGADGDDNIIGGAGNDLIDGGANGLFGDFVDYASASSGVTVSLTTGVATDDLGGTDTTLVPAGP